MSTFPISKVTVTDASGNSVPEAVTVTFQNVSNRRAVICFAEGVCAGGFHPEQAIRIEAGIPTAVPYFAIENHSPFWCRPTWGKDLGALPDRVQELLFRSGDRFTAILPLCGDTFKTVICGAGDAMAFRMYANAPVAKCGHQPVFLAMEGEHPHELLTEIARAAAEFLGIPLRSERPVAEAFDRFGWCSWDAMQIRVDHAGMLRKAEEFSQKKVPVGFAIFDDMWADVPALNAIPRDASFREMVIAMHGSRLRRFEGDPVRFPKGMKQAVTDLKKAGIPKVGIWFPTTGYWAGLEPESETERRERNNLVTTANGQRIVAPEAEQANAYFDDLCAEAHAWGADFVKIDNQGYHDRYRNLAPIGKSAKVIQNAIDTATEKHFGGALINCMGMPSECMFNRRSAVCRCSDDFIPESREWFAKNILQCSFNGLLQGQFYVNDWDMWWTDDEQAAKNSLCRAVSGGPIYVSDQIGRTRPEILKPLMLRDGRILRPDVSATPTDDCILHDPTESDRIFKIRNRVGENGLIAAFNISAGNLPVRGTVSPKDAGLCAGEYAYYEFFTQTAGILRKGETVPLTLEDNDTFRLFTFVPLKNGVAALGRTDLFIGIKAVTEHADGRVTLCEAGTVGFVSLRELTVTYADGTPVPTVQNGVLSLADAKETTLYYQSKGD